MRQLFTAMLIGAVASWATAQSPTNRAPDALGLMPESTGVHFSPETAKPVAVLGGDDTDALKEGEFVYSTAGSFWVQRHRPQFPSGAPPLDEVDIYWKNAQGAWGYVRTLTPPASAGSTSEFGAVIVASGNRLFIGAPSAKNANSVPTGAVFVYEMNDWVLSPVQTIELPDGSVADKFGASLAVDGDRLIVGAPGREKPDGGITIHDAGAVFLYQKNTAWEYLRSEWSLVAQEGGQFGFSVGLRGRLLVVGAPFEDGVFDVGGVATELQNSGTLHLGRWDKPGQLLGFHNLFSIFDPVQQKAQGLANSHFGWSVAVDSLMRVVVSMPDSSWTTGDAMSDWNSGVVMLLNWNGSVEEDYSLNVTGFSNADLPAGARFGEHLEESSAGSDFGIGTGQREENAPVQFYATTAVQASPGEIIGGALEPSNLGGFIGMDEDGDSLAFSLPAADNYYSRYFQVSPTGKLQGKANLAEISDGVYWLGVEANDGSAGVLRKRLAVEVSGALTDTDGDLLPDAWESLYGFDPNTANGGVDPDADGWTNLQEFQQGTPPTLADRDNDGVSDEQELADGTDPSSALSKALPISWTSHVNTTSQGIAGGISKTSGAASTYDADAVSTKFLIGDGMVSFRVASGSHLMLGFNGNNTSRDYLDLNHSWHPQSNGNLAIFEGNTNVGNFGTWTPTTWLSIRRVADTIYYLKNFVVVHTSTIKTRQKLLIDTAFYQVGSQIAEARLVTGDNDGDGMLDSWEVAQIGGKVTPDDVANFLPTADPDGDANNNLLEFEDRTDPYDALSRLEPVVWTSLRSTVAVGTDGGLQKNAGGADWGGDALASKKIIGDGEVQFVPGSTWQYMAVGLNHINENTSYTDLNYAFCLIGSGQFVIMEGGTQVPSIGGTFYATTVFRITRNAGVIRYFADNVLVYTSSATSTNPLHVDCSIFNLADNFVRCRYSTGDADGDGMSDAWEVAQLPAGAGASEVQAYLPTADSDSDGVTNYQEYVDGTNASSALSRLEPVDWTAHRDTQSVGSNGSLKKIAGANNWSGDAVASKRIVGDGEVRFIPGQTTSWMIVGFSTANAAASPADTSHAILVNSTSSYQVYESGLAIAGTIGTYSAATQFRVVRKGETVMYYVDNALIYESTQKCLGKVFVDCNLFNINDTLALCKYSHGDTDNDGLSDAWELAQLPLGAGYDQVLNFPGGADSDEDGISDAQELADESNRLNPLSKMESVVWTAHINTTSQGTNGGLRKTGGAAAYDADAMATKSLKGDGRIVFRVAAGSHVLVGLNAYNQGQGYADLDYSFHPQSTGVVEIYESGAAKLNVGTYDSSTVFAMERRGELVRYWKDGALVYTSATKAYGNLFLDTAFLTLNSEILEARIDSGDIDGDGMPDAWELAQLPAGSGYDDVVNHSGALDDDGDGRSNLQEYREGTDPRNTLNVSEPVVWTAHVNTTSQGSNGGLKQNTGASGNADAVSTRKILVDGRVTFMALPGSHFLLGLNGLNSSRLWEDLDYELHPKSDGSVWVYEFGAQKVSLGTWNVNTVFAIERVAGIVRYFKDGILAYVSETPSCGPLMVDAAFYGNGSEVAECRLVNGDLDADGMLDSWELTQLSTGAGMADLQNYLPTADPDGDGVSNLQEFLDGTNPASNLSKGEYVMWTNHRNLTNANATGGVSKVSGTNGAWDADAISNKRIIGDGWVELNSSHTAAQYFVGLNSVNDNASYTDLEFAFYCETVNASIWESGTQIVGLGKMTPGTVLRIERQGEAIRYVVDNRVVYTSTKKSRGNLLADCGVLGTGHNFTQTRIATGDLDNDGISDLWELAQLAPGATLSNLQNYPGSVDTDGDGVNDSREYADGTDPKNATSRGQVVTWTNHVNTTVQGTGGGLKKTAGATNSWNSQAISVQKLIADGRLVAKGAGGSFMVGLNKTDTTASFEDLDFGFYFNSNGVLEIYEGGSSKGNVGGWTTATEARIDRQGSTVRYYKDGVLVYTSTAASSDVLVVDTSFYALNSELSSCRLVNGDIDNDDISDAWEFAHLSPGAGMTELQNFLPGGDYDGDGVSNLVEFWEKTNPLDPQNYMETVVWTSHRNTQSQGTNGGLGKIAGSADWKGDAISTKKMAGNGELEFTPGVNSKNSIAGLNEANDSDSINDLNYGIVATPTGYIVQEQGVNRQQGSYAADSVFRVRRVGDTVTYYKDDVLLYTSLRKSILPLMADAAFYQNGDSFARCRFRFGVKNTDAIADAWKQRLVDANPNDSLISLADITGLGDFDQDGLTDLEEWQRGTDPLLADTDLDQMPDFWEVQHYLNPMVTTDAGSDPDGDGWSNLEEYLVGSSPRVPNASGPGSPLNIFALGLTNQRVPLGSIPNLNLLTGDVDLDELPDSWEMEHHQTLAYGPSHDRDGDGLTEAGEYFFETDPNSTDSDFDGTSDWAEFLAVTGLQPQDFVASMMNPHAGALQWTEGCSFETNFKVQRSTDSGATWTDVQTLEANSTSAGLRGLEQGVSYQFRVVALSPYGNSTSSVLAVQTPLERPVALTRSQTQAVKADGSLWTWGAGGQSGSFRPVQREAPEFVSISSVESHSLGVSASGGLWAWGENGSGQLGLGDTDYRSVPVELTGGSASRGIATGQNHSVAVKADGTVWTWGSNSSGQLGSGNTTDSHVPIQVPGLTGVAAVAAGYKHSLALKLDGTVWVWGANEFGQVGNNSRADSHVPVQVAGLTDAVKVVGGGEFCLALKADGTVWAWGRGFPGQLGAGNFDDALLPVQAVGLTDVVDVAAGYWHSLALKADGTVWAWGWANAYIIGNNGESPDVPVQVPGLSNVLAIQAGYDHSAAVRSDGSLWTWGGNWHGQLGKYGHLFTSTPAVSGTSEAVDVSVRLGGLVLRNNGAVMAWGHNSVLGSASRDHAATPLQITGLSGVAKISSGFSHGMAVKGDGSVLTWGGNQSGQLGSGTNESSSSPVVVNSLEDVKEVSGGEEFSLALASNGIVWSWGGNGSGQLGDGSTSSRTLPQQVPNLADVAHISAGRQHTLALLEDGTVSSWGWNSYGQLGINSTTDSLSPVTIAGLTNIIAVSSGYDHSLALRADGTVWAWGSNEGGQLGDNTYVSKTAPFQVLGLSGVVAISAGLDHSLALKADGTVWGWGKSHWGQLGFVGEDALTPIPVPGLDGVKKISSGHAFSSAVREDGSVVSWGLSWFGEAGVGLIMMDSVPSPVQGFDFEHPAPTVQASSSAGSTAVHLGQSTSITASVTAGDAPVSSVSFYHYGVLLATDEEAPFEFQFTPSTWGDFPISVSATDSLGVKSARSADVLVHVPYEPDTDSDGLPDWWENLHHAGLTHVGTDFVDGDDLNELGEYFFGTDPNDNDTDGDGISDWEEFLAAHNLTPQGVSATAIRPTSLTLTWTDASSIETGFEVQSSVDNGTTWIASANVAANTTAWTLRGLKPQTNYQFRVRALSPFGRPAASDAIVAETASVRPLAAGRWHTHAVKDDGTLWTWGSSWEDGKFRPEQLSGPEFVAMSSNRHTLAVGEDGTLWVWGFNEDGQLGTGGDMALNSPTQLPGYTGVTAVAVGLRHSLALKSDGTVWAWGDNAQGQLGTGGPADSNTPVQVSSLSNVVAIAAGYDFSLALKADGTILAWGNGDTGQLGNGATAGSNLPVPVTGLTEVVAIAAGSGHALALKKDGSVWAWGRGNPGVLGNGDSASTSVPVLVSDLTEVVDIAAGDPYSIALKSDGTVWAWGGGFLFDNIMSTSDVPVQIAELTGVFSVFAGHEHLAAVKMDGSLWTWGSNWSGQLGVYGSLRSPVPAVLPTLAGATDVRIRDAGLALMANGTVYSWGEYHALGNGGRKHTSVPELISGLSGVKAIALGASHALAVKMDGTVVSWGENFWGQLGNDPAVESLVPASVTSLTDVVEVAAGNFYSIARLGDGTLRSWGNNADGQLGDGSTDQRNSPVVVEDAVDVARVSAGVRHVLALKTDGTVLSWGWNSHGQLGDDAGSFRSLPAVIAGLSGVTDISAGYQHSLALKNDGTVWAWGSNADGQLGNNGTADSLVPVQVPGLTDVVAVSAGSFQSIALKSDGTVWAWGNGAWGSLGINGLSGSRVPIQVVGIEGGVKIASGNGSNIALRSDHSVAAWGSSWMGNLGTGLTFAHTTPNRVEGFDFAREVPSVEISSPANNTNVYLTRSKTVTADFATGTGAPASVSFFQHGVLLATDNEAPFQYTFAPTTWGDYQISAIGTDSLGLKSVRSQAVTLHVPANSDSEPDGLPDWWEMENHATLTHSGTEDVDGDGLNELGEYLFGSNPNDGDSDDDGQTDWQEFLAEHHLMAQNLVISAVRATSVTLEWQDECDVESSFALMMSADEGATWTEAGNVPANAQRGGIRGLSPSASYQFRVVTITPYGNAQSAIVTSQTSAELSVAASMTKAYAIRQDGSLWTWGSSTDQGQFRPVHIEHSGPGYTQLASTDSHVLALKQDGTVWAWGGNEHGQLGRAASGPSAIPVEIGGMSGYKAVATGARHSIALKNDGTVWTWGGNSRGQLGQGHNDDSSVPTQIADLDNVVAIAGGYLHSMALKSDGSVWAWGSGEFGQLGRNTDEDRNVPLKIVDEWADIVKISAGREHSMMLKSDGTVWACGSGTYGQLGRDSWAESWVPTQAQGLSDVVDIAAGSQHSLAIKADGSVYAYGWGIADTYGAYPVNRQHPTLVPGIVNAVALAGGDRFSMVVVADGSLKTWGNNSFGQLGRFGKPQLAVPTYVDGQSSVKHTSARTGVATVKENGTVWAWGAPWSVGMEYVESPRVPVQVSGLTGAKTVATGSDHALAVSSTDTVVAWGLNGMGQLGNGSSDASTAPVAVSYLAEVAEVAAGHQFSLARSNTGFVWGWGSNSSGQTGSNSMGPLLEPETIGGLAGVLAISAGREHALALMSNHTVRAWGANGSGQLGNVIFLGDKSNVSVVVSNLSSIVQISAGNDHSLALDSNGHVWAWGLNSSGQLGNNSVTNSTQAIRIIGLANIVAVAAGEDHSLALRSDGTVWAWGAGNRGQLTPALNSNSLEPVQVTGAQHIRQIMAGNGFSQAVQEDGTLLSWGASPDGQLGLGLSDKDSVARSVEGLNLTHSVPQISLATSDNSGSGALGQPQTVVATFTGGDQSPQSVTFYHEGVLLGTDNSAPFSYTLQPLTWGQHTITATGTDTLGALTARSTDLAIEVPYDNDNDGLPDWWEYRHHGSLAHTGTDDVDGDGLTEAGEFFRDTFPTDQDSNDDSISDGASFAEESGMVPAGLVVSERHASAIKLEWQCDYPYETSFRIEKSLDAGATWVTAGSAPVNATAYTVTGLPEKTAHKFRVTTVSLYGNGTSEVVAASTKPAAPSSPTGLAVQTSSATSVLLVWQDTAGNETSYIVEGKESGGTSFQALATAAADGSSASVSGLVGATAYVFRVKAVNTDGTETVYSLPSGELNLPPLGAAPTGLVVQSSSWDQAHLTWDTLPVDPDRIAVRVRGYDASGAVQRLQIDLHAGATSYADAGLESATTYQYRVASVNLRGESLSAPASVTTVSLLPTAPTGVVLTALGARAMKVQWTDNAINETSYVVERAMSAGASTWQQSPSLAFNTVVFQDQVGLQGGTNYYYRVRAINGAGSTVSSVVSGATSSYPGVNLAPECLGIMPDDFTLFAYEQSPGQYTGPFTHSLDSTNKVVDGTKDGDSMPTGSGSVYFLRSRPTSPAGAPPNDQVIRNVFDSSGNFTSATALTTPANATGFGTCVVVSGGRLFVGAPGALNSANTASGVVYVYELDAAGVVTSSSPVVIEPPSGSAGDEFGSAVAVDGNRMIVGAPGRDRSHGSGTSANAGAVFLYERTTGWGLVRTEWSTVSDYQHGGKFGFSVALRGSYFVVGAPYEDAYHPNYWSGLADAGCVYFGRWDKAGQLLDFQNLFLAYGSSIDVSGLVNSHFGYSVAMDDQLQILVGMPDPGWQSSDPMHYFNGGALMGVHWNGQLDGDYLLVLNYMHYGLAQGARTGSYVENTQDSEFIVSTDLVGANNITIRGMGNRATAVEPGQVVASIDVNRRAGQIVGIDLNDDPLAFSIPGANNPLGPFFTIEQGNVLKARPLLSLAEYVSYALKLSVADDRGGLTTKTFNVFRKGAGDEPREPDSDNDGIPDTWEVLFGLDKLNAGDSLIDADGDGFTAYEEYLRWRLGLGIGTNPQLWDLGEGDLDGDGVPNNLDADPNDPAVGAFGINITAPVNLQTL